MSELRPAFLQGFLAALVVALSFSTLSCAADDAATERVELEAGPNTTVHEDPLREDGIVDYAAALNRELSEGATTENNAFVALLRIMPIGQWDEEHRRKTFELLGLPEQTGEEPGRLVAFEDFVGKPFVYVAWDNPSEETIADYEQRQAAAMPAHQRQYEQAQEGPWTAEDLPLVAEWLQANDSALSDLAQAVHRPRYWAPVVVPEDSDHLIKTLMPHLGGQRALARTLSFRVHLHLGEGDLAAAWRDVMTLMRLARLPGHDQTLISGLVGVSINYLALEAISVIVNDPTLTAAQARGMLADLQGLPAMPKLAEWLQAERLFTLDFLQNFKTRLDAMAAFTPDLVQSEAQQKALDLFGQAIATDQALLDQAMRHFNDLWDELLAISNTEPASLMVRRYEALMTRLDKRVEALDSLLQDPEAVGAMLALPEDQPRQRLVQGMVDVLAQITTPAVGSALLVHPQDAMREDLALIALALAAHRAEQGDYPQTLDALVPDYLDALPTDRFADGRPQYELTEDAAIVYSIGRDFEDDGGVDDPHEGDLVVRLRR